MKVLGGLVAALTWYLYIILVRSSGPVNRLEDVLLLAVPVVPLILVLWAAMRRSERGEKTAAVWLLAAAPVVSVLAFFCFFAVVLRFSSSS
jgi:drug/metabolite transporter (DMT)-like permease